MQQRGSIRRLGAAMSVALAASVAAVGATSAQADTIVVKIETLKALDQLDPVGQADFFARVTMDGEVHQTKRIRRHNVVNPNWEFTKTTNKRSIDVKIEIFDKDVLTRSDLIDINRIDNKRDLDFTVEPGRRGRCRVVGFAGGYSCGDKIIRAGRERKAAEITFSVHNRR